MKAKPESLLPGTRIELRDSEWLINRTERSRRAQKLIFARGLSGVVREKDAVFVYDLEESIKVIDPVKTELIADKSSYFRDTLLYLEGQLHNRTPNDNKPVISQYAAIDFLPFQFRPTEMALAAPRVRLLIADDVGLGKTLQAGILTTELIRRGRAKRILVVVSKSMLVQFQKEFWTRFTIPLTRLDSVGIKKLREKIPSNHNPFHYVDRSIISIDTLKNDLQYRTAIENAWWDLIIIDEAQNVAERQNSEESNSQRSRLATRLAKQSDALVLLSATPHDGSRKSFASLMKMLDTKSIADVDNYGPEDIKGLFIRRFRTSPDVKRDFEDKVPKRDTQQELVSATSAEDFVFDQLANIKLESDANVSNPSKLFKVILEKAFLSSPAACMETLNNRLKKVKSKSGSAASGEDGDTLESLLKAVSSITRKDFSKYNRLLKILEEIEWDSKNKSDRIVIFSERIATIDWLAKNLRIDLGLEKEAVVELHGRHNDIKIQKIVDDFGQENQPVRILLASDMASEGINLHFQSHKLFHFDIPWSLMTFQQRNGRIDRYGQTNQPKIWYLMSESKNSKIRGDQRILEILIQKSMISHESIGDESVFFDSDDVEKQNERVTRAIATEEDPLEFSRELESNAERKGNSESEILRGILKNANNNSNEKNSESTLKNGQSQNIFKNDMEFTVELLNRLNENSYDIAFDTENNTLHLTIPSELHESGDLGVGSKSEIDNRWMPREALPFDAKIRFTNKPEIVKEQIRRSRSNDENSWPEYQYLWKMHPMMDWFCDKAINIFGRNQAPVMKVESLLSSDEVVFLLNGLVPNLHGHPIIDEWVGVFFSNGKFVKSQPLDEFLNLLNLDNKVANPGTLDIGGIDELKGKAVEEAQNHVRSVRNAVQKKIDDELEAELMEHSAFKERHISQIKSKFSKSKGPSKKQKEQLELEISNSQVEFDNYWKWIKESRQTEDNKNPHVRIVAAFMGQQ